MNILKQVIIETERRIKKELEKCEKIKEGFSKLLDSKSTTFRQDLKNIMKGGKYSFEKMEKAYERERQLMSQQRALNDLKFFHPDLTEKD